MSYQDGESCGHPGCLSHTTHPCEGCGRIAGKSHSYADPNAIITHVPPTGTVEALCSALKGIDLGKEDRTVVSLHDPDNQMTQEQKDFFIWLAQMGICCGLESPLEWLLNYHIHMGNLERYEDFPAKTQLSWECMFAFYKGTGPEFEDMTLEQFHSWVELQIEVRRKYAIEAHEKGKDL